MPFGPEHKSTFGESMDRLVEPTAHDLLCDYADYLNVSDFKSSEDIHNWIKQGAALRELIREYRRLHG